jgi:hypothetical protein
MPKLICLFILLFHCLLSMAQHFVTKEGAFMDTTGSASPQANTLLYYYSVGGKYPKSSATLLQEVTAFTKKQTVHYRHSGYITFRFVIDTTGHMFQKVQVLQTDQHYNSFQFEKELVNDLYMYVKTLNKWKIARQVAGKAYPYNAFITFKMKDGKVINVIP